MSGFSATHHENKDRWTLDDVESKHFDLHSHATDRPGPSLSNEHGNTRPHAACYCDSVKPTWHMLILAKAVYHAKRYVCVSVLA